MSQDWLLASADALAAQLPDGAKIAVPHDTLGVAMETTRALIRRGAKNLHVVCVPIGGLQVDLLIGAGCVGTLETSAITFGEYGTPYRFHDALKQGAIRMLDATCPAIHAALEAGHKDIPFIPLRGLLGSDLVVHRPDWKTIDNPFAQEGAAHDPILLLPAIRPDFAVFHAPYADRDGNVFIGRRRDLATMLPAIYVGHAAIAQRGAWPCGLWDLYATDEAHFRRYGELARTSDGFARYLDEFVHVRRQAAE